MRDTTRILFIDSAATLTNTYRKGLSYDVPTALAVDLVTAGAAVVEPLTPEVVAVPVVDQGEVVAVAEVTPIKRKGARNAVVTN